MRWLHPTGGRYVWLTLPEGVDAGTESPRFAAALKAGVLYVPGGVSYAAEGIPIAANTIRLSFGASALARRAEPPALPIVRKLVADLMHE